MSVGKLFLIIAILTLLVWTGCSSDSTTGPEIDDTVPSDGLVIAYVTDDAAAVTGDITSSSGGTLETTATDGVVYKLVVPPNAVSATVAVTMTPLASLTITALRSLYCPASRFRSAAPRWGGCERPSLTPTQRR